MSNERAYEIGYHYLEKNNVHAALPHLHKAALNGHPIAQLWLESLYTQGHRPEGL
jgi:hypothetical protein